MGGGFVLIWEVLEMYEVLRVSILRMVNFVLCFICVLIIIGMGKNKMVKLVMMLVYRIVRNIVIWFIYFLFWKKLMNVVIG